MMKQRRGRNRAARSSRLGHAVLAVLILLPTTASAAVSVPRSYEPIVRPEIDDETPHTQGDLDASEKALEDDLRRNPESTLALLGLSKIREQRGDLIGALQFARKAVQNEPNGFLPHILAGRILAKLGNVSEALKELSGARQLEPKNPAAYLIAAVLLGNSNRSEEAIEVLEEGLDLGLDSSEIVVELGYLLLDQGAPDRALQLSEAAHESDPESGELCLVIGLALAEDPERRQEAPRWIEKALSQGVSEPDRVRLKLAELQLETEDYEGAIASLEAAEQTLPDLPQIQYRLGLARQATGDVKGAEKALGRFKELKAAQDLRSLRIKQIGTSLNEAQSLAAENKLSEALDRLQGLLATYPFEPRVLTLQAKIFFSMRRTEEALASVVTARRLVPGRIENHYLEALMLSRLGRLPEARTAVERALTLDSELAEAHALLGEIAYRQEDFEPTVEHFGLALRQGLDEPTLRLHYAEALEHLGRLEESQIQMQVYRQLQDE